MVLGLAGCLASRAEAQEEEVMRAALYLTACATEEEVDEGVVQLLEMRWGRPVRVNAPGLRAAGILSEYQLASLADYRSRCGDILSWEELALVDGFSREAVQALKPFLSLESAMKPGAVRDSLSRLVHGKALVRGTLKQWGAKAKLYGESWQLQAAWRAGDWTAGAEYTQGRSHILLGHFNLRFGQGLGLWTGFSMESLSTVQAFVRRPTGIAPVWSFNPSGVPFGAAYQYSRGRFKASTFVSLDPSALTAGSSVSRNAVPDVSVISSEAVESLTAGLRAEWLALRGQAACTVFASPGDWGLSLDGRYNLRCTDIVAEAAYRHQTLAGKVAVSAKLGERLRLAAQVRALPSSFSGKKYGEYALGAGGGWQSERRMASSGVPAHQLSLTLDASLLPIPGTDPRRRQVRAWASWSWQPGENWTTELRFTERWRNYERPRSDFRADLRYHPATWMFSFRTETVHCERWGFLTYLEGGYKGGILSAYLRVTGFYIDSWNDRIYCYERDAPGTFSVPAYSGRGAALSLVSGYKLRLGHFVLKAHLRAACNFRVTRALEPTLNLQLQCER